MEYKMCDDCDWQRVYPLAHYKDTVEIEKDHSFQLPGIHTINNGKIQHDEKPLLPNAQWLYEKIYELKPQSIFEMGFGYANHLISIHRMMPDVVLAGCEISGTQIENALERYDFELEKIYTKYKLVLGDFLHLYIKEKYDIVYSQAVLMHMATEKSMVALEKMCGISNKYVICLEGGLTIPDSKRWLQQLGKVTFFDEWADKYWKRYNVSPFIIEV